MKIKLNGWTITDDALKAAKWEEVESGNSTTYACDDYDKVILARQKDDESWWDGIEADVAALDADGKPCTIHLSLDKCDDESSHIYINDAEECPAGESESGERYYAYGLAEIAGYSIGGRMRLDYEQAADEFLTDHEGWIYVMDNRRGFANEWTLYACKNDSEAKEIERLYADTARYSADDARTWIVSALESREDYRANHAADKCCGMMYATDDPNYGTPSAEGCDND